MWSLNFLLVFLVVFKSNSSPTGERSDHIELYSNRDNVEILTIKNFKRKIENSSKAWIVEFYAGWCGDCQRFAPSWKTFANDVMGWKDLVQVASLACSDDINTPICRVYEVNSYPTVRYFHENYEMSSENLGAIINVTNVNAQAHRHRLIDQILVEQSEGRGLIYPNLLPYNMPDTYELINYVRNNPKFIFLLVLAPAEAYLGAEVALDLHKTHDIAIKYSLNSNSELITKMKIEKFPAILIVDTNNNYQVEILYPKQATREEIKADIVSFLQSKDVEVVEEHLQMRKHPVDMNIVEERKGLMNRIKEMGDVVFQMDLETAVRYSLKQEVATTKIISNDQLDALLGYVEVLKKYFPFGHGAFLFLNDLTNAISNTSEIEGAIIGEIVKRAETSGLVFSTSYTYLGCEGSSSRYRGYPCSLWRLFHYLTVNAAIQQNTENPREILDAMYGYIKHFFSCETCSKHFQQMTIERNMTNVSSLDDAILWLWSAHNFVNKRLAGDLTEDPEFPKYQFPKKDNCPNCSKEDNSWNREEVLKYLKTIYSSYNVRYLGANTNILFPGLDYL